MGKQVTTAILAGALSLVPLVGFASTSSQAKTQPVAKHASANAVAMHATRGVVKSVDATTLVITRAGKKRGEMTFALNPSTHRKGSVAVGAPVSIRYREDGKTYLATAITVQQAKQRALHSAPSKR